MDPVGHREVNVMKEMRAGMRMMMGLVTETTTLHQTGMTKERRFEEPLPTSLIRPSLNPHLLLPPLAPLPAPRAPNTPRNWSGTIPPFNYFNSPLP